MFAEKFRRLDQRENVASFYAIVKIDMESDEPSFERAGNPRRFVCICAHPARRFQCSGKISQLGWLGLDLDVFEILFRQRDDILVRLRLLRFFFMFFAASDKCHGDRNR